MAFGKCQGCGDRSQLYTGTDERQYCIRCVRAKKSTSAPEKKEAPAKPAAPAKPKEEAPATSAAAPTRGGPRKPKVTEEVFTAAFKKHNGNIMEMMRELELSNFRSAQRRCQRMGLLTTGMPNAERKAKRKAKSASTAAAPANKAEESNGVTSEHLLSSRIDGKLVQLAIDNGSQTVHLIIDGEKTTASRQVFTAVGAMIEMGLA